MKIITFLLLLLVIGAVLFSSFFQGNITGDWYKYKDNNENASAKFANEIILQEFISKNDINDKYLVIYDKTKGGAYCKETKFSKYICTPMTVIQKNFSSKNNLEDIIASYDLKKSFLAKVSVWNFGFMKKMDISLSNLDDECLLNNKCSYLKEITYLSFSWETAKNLFFTKKFEL